MDLRVGEGVAGAMGLTDRLVAAVIGSDAPLDRATIEREVAIVASREAPLASIDDLQAVVDSIIGLGPLEQLLRDPQVTDVLVNSHDEIWVEKAGRLCRAGVSFRNDEEVVAAVERVISPLGLRLDRSSPAVDARLADGSRLHAMIPPAAVGHPVLAIRRFTQAVPDLEALVDAGSTDAATARRLAEAVAGRKTILVSGATGTGKTTLLNVLSTHIPITERVVVIEDASELKIPGHAVRLESHPPNLEGRGEITLSHLMRSALRLRPDRIILGEVRGPEALHLLTAINTGHRGSLSTVHANSPDEARWRLETLAMMGGSGIPAGVIRRQLDAGLDVIVQLERRQGARFISEVSGL